MGTIIALGGGRYDDGEVMPIFERIVRESGKKNPHVVFLPTAGHDDTEGDEPIWESFEKLGCTVETLKLTDPANSREHRYNTLVSTDIVYAGGGNLQFMMNTFKATGADEAQAVVALDASGYHCKTAIVMILCGVSAGEAGELLARAGGRIAGAVAR